MTRKPTPLSDNIAGKVKRTIGEIAGRPDLVLDGEAQDTGCPREDESKRKNGAPPSPRTNEQPLSRDDN